MPYQIKNQDTTPPSPDAKAVKSVNKDGFAALAIAGVAAGLIALIIVLQIV